MSSTNKAPQAGAKAGKPDPKASNDRVTRTKEITGITHIQVIALQEGGRHRAGRHWPQEHVTVPIDEFTDEQVEALLEDKKLMVVPISGQEQEPTGSGSQADET